MNCKKTAMIATAVGINILATASTIRIKEEYMQKKHDKNIEILSNYYENKIKEKDKSIEDMNNSIKDMNKSIEDLKNNIKSLEEDKEKLKKELANTVNLELTYYTTLPCENGGYTTTAIQTRLRHGVIASNYYPIGTKILIEGTVYTVEDRGSSNFDGPNRLDVLVERRSGEYDSEYLKRVNNMGRKKVKGRILE